MRSELLSSIEWYAGETNLDREQKRALSRGVRYYSSQIAKVRRAQSTHTATAFANFVSEVITNEKHIIINSIHDLSLSRRRPSRLAYKPRSSSTFYSVPSLQRLRTDLALETRDDVGVPIRQWTEEKPGGGYRVLNDFCTLDRGRQRILADIIQKLHPVSPFEYAISGRGRECLVQNIIEQIQSGISFWAELDIRNAYPSINNRHIASLLPPIREVSDVACVCARTSATNSPTGQQLPQGGFASQSVLGAIVGREAQALTSLPQVILSYSDNVWIGAPTWAEVASASEELTERLRALAAGPLALVSINTCDFNRRDQFDAMGYTFKKFSDDPQRLHVSISNKSFHKFKSRVEKQLDAVPLADVPREFETRKNSWLCSFSQRRTNDHAEEYYQLDLQRFLFEYLEVRTENEC